jgi:Protein of unknown function (DUF2794)
MSEGEVAERMRGGLDTVVSFPAPSHPGPTHPAPSHPALSRPAPSQVSFDRHELRTILDLYGRKVAAGEWRDYAIDFTFEKAVFSIFRRSSEVPLYRIEKDPRLARRQGAYAVVAGTGLTLKRGHDLRHVLRAIDRPMRVVSRP